MQHKFDNKLVLIKLEEKMDQENIQKTKWYHCSTCLRYSFAPEKCCDKMMIEEDEAHEENKNFQFIALKLESNLAELKSRT